MAKILNCPDEVLLHIGSFIERPRDALHLVRSCKRMHGLIVPLLYENVRLTLRNHTAYPRGAADRLKSYLSRSDRLESRQYIRYLELDVHYSFQIDIRDKLKGLFLNSKALQHVIFDMRSTYNQRFPHGAHSFLPIRQALRYLSPTLKSLCLLVGDHYLRSGLWPRNMGDLRHLVSLERLQIPGYLLFNAPERLVHGPRCRWKLPQQLRELQLRYYTLDASGGAGYDENGHFTIRLRGEYSLVFLRRLTTFINGHCQTMSRLRKLSLELPAKTADLSKDGALGDLAGLIRVTSRQKIIVKVKTTEHNRECRCP